MITIQIPVSLHVKKFLLSWYGEGYILNLHDSLGKAVHGLLRKKINTVRGTLKMQEPYYTIHIPMSKAEKEGCVIHPNNLYLISEQFDKYFRDIAFSYVMIHSAIHNGQQKEGLREVLTAFNMTEDDISLDSLYRDLKRKKSLPPYTNMFKDKFFMENEDSGEKNI